MKKSVYLIRSKETGDYKIGISKNPKKRLKQLQTGNSSELELLEIFETEYAHKVEKALHNLFSHAKKEGEWFELSLNERFDFRYRCNTLEENFEIIEKIMSDDNLDVL